MSTYYQQQLVLGFPEHDDRDFTTYYAGPNQALLDHLKAFWSSERPNSNLYIWGAPETGRTHLLHALCQESIEYERSAFYLPLKEYLAINEAFDEQVLIQRLEGLEGMDLILLDDIDVLTGQHYWQEALFHLYNRMQETGGRMVFSASVAPRYLSIDLQDLKSRFSHSLIYQIESLTDEQKCAAFLSRARARGISLSVDVANYIMSRCQRSFAHLIEVLDRLDRRSLEAKRRMTIPFVKEVMGW